MSLLSRGVEIAIITRMSTPEKFTANRIQAHRIDQWYLTLRTAIRGGCTVAVCYFGFDALEQFAGESTKVDVVLSLFLFSFGDRGDQGTALGHFGVGGLRMGVLGKDITSQEG